MKSARTSSGLILAGGASRRMGTDKAALMVDGQTLLDRTVKVLGSVVDEVLVVGLRHAPNPASPVQFIPDDVPNAGPLGGLLSGLRRARNLLAVVVACDLPFLSADVLRYLLELAPGYDAVVPRFDGQNQSLHAVYARHVQSLVERQIAQGRLKVDHLLEALHVRWVEESELDSRSLGRRSFVNVNTPADWAAALHLARQEQPAASHVADRWRYSPRN